MRKKNRKEPTFATPIPSAVALKPSRACEYLDISHSTLKRLVKRGDLPYTRFLKGREKRFLIKDLDALLIKGLQQMAGQKA